MLSNLDKRLFNKLHSIKPSMQLYCYNNISTVAEMINFKINAFVLPHKYFKQLHSYCNIIVIYIEYIITQT